MPSDTIVTTGTVQAARGNGFFTIFLDSDNRTVLCQLSGKIRTHNINIVTGDKVDIELDPFDLQKGRIIYRRRG